MGLEVQHELMSKKIDRILIFRLKHFFNYIFSFFILLPFTWTFKVIFSAVFGLCHCGPVASVFLIKVFSSWETLVLFLSTPHTHFTIWSVFEATAMHIHMHAHTVTCASIWFIQTFEYNQAVCLYLFKQYLFFLTEPYYSDSSAFHAFI